MEIVTQPDLYSPSLDDKGNYVDKIPPFSRIKKGLICPCGARKDKVYETHGVFSTHIKSKNHQKWLENLNLNKANYYIENEQLRETIQNQRLIIARMEKEMIIKCKTIDYLTNQLISPTTTTTSKVVTDLLDFD